MNYNEAKQQAQASSDSTGFDFGIEKLGDEYQVFMLPARGNRYGRDVRCEVVMCTNLAKCQPGHGPKKELK